MRRSRRRASSAGWRHAIERLNLALFVDTEDQRGSGGPDTGRREVSLAGDEKHGGVETMGKTRMDLSFVGKLLEEQDEDVLRERIRVLSQV